MGILNWQAAADFARRIIGDYDVKCPSPEASVRLLSGGNMQKLILGRALDGEPDVILGQPATRGLDVGAVAYVHRKLIEARDRGAAVLLISEDLDEIQSLSDRVVVMSGGRLLRRPNAANAVSENSAFSWPGTDWMAQRQPTAKGHFMRLEPRPSTTYARSIAYTLVAIGVALIFASVLVMLAGATRSMCSGW